MKSWDLFDTLVAARDINIPSGDQPEGFHFPIMDAVSCVGQDDLIISDYYDFAKADRILRAVTGLKNRLVVGRHIKASGRIWRFLSVDEHTGDSPREIASARRFGIKGNLVRRADLTNMESYLYDAGCRGLALVLREARLTTAVTEDSDIKLLQLQGNVPFLFAASLLLHRKAIAQQIETILMCSRDSYLWITMLHAVQGLLDSVPYGTQYFFSSRLMRYRSTPHTLAYTKDLLRGRSAIVDLCGSGYSLKAFCNHLDPRPLLWLAVAYKREGWPYSGVPYAIQWRGKTTLELANLAPHPMVGDVIGCGHDRGYSPVYINPTFTRWDTSPVIKAMHNAFYLALKLFPEYDFTSDLLVESDLLRDVMTRCLGEMDANDGVVAMLAGGVFSKEEHFVRTTRW
ncbi:hypothetical protein HDF16_005486 [Granulicella aggregans]|uniref:Uncharacterized protein n=1 Tax=Granulicella aggregans TaxID=474949 RepID=A0A7W7ZIV7_9BACT|nr:hypothetical protein [Granulicella aggregans]MBB5060750.1 hypothetical protein [Granulicella aggregans]